MIEKVVRTYVDGDGMAKIVCPKCFRAKNYSVSKYVGKDTPIKVKCKCDFKFQIQLEFRKVYRKEVNLEGRYFLNKQDDFGVPAIIIDISEKGVALEIKINEHIRIGDKGKVVFNLDNKKKTELEKKVVVRKINDSMIGCEFTDNQVFEKELGFYLRMPS